MSGEVTNIPSSRWRPARTSSGSALPPWSATNGRPSTSMLQGTAIPWSSPPTIPIRTPSIPTRWTISSVWTCQMRPSASICGTTVLASTASPQSKGKGARRAPAGALVLCGATWLAESPRQRKEVHPVTTEKEAELERTTRLRGFRYGLHDFLAEVDLNALKAVNDHVEADYVNESLLDRKTKELLIMVACGAQGDLVSHLQIHMHAANKDGATRDEV